MRGPFPFSDIAMTFGSSPFGFSMPSLASDDPNSYWQAPLLDPNAAGAPVDPNAVTLPELSVTAPAPVAAPAAAPAATLPALAPSASTPIDGSIQDRFIGALRNGGMTNPYGLGAMAAYGQHESRYSPRNLGGSWSDPSESGAPGQSGGIMSWRNERLDNMRRATAGADDPVAAQAAFLLKENPALTQALQNSKSADESNRLMADAWKFAGYNRPGGEFAARLATTRDYANKFANGQSVGSTAASGAFSLGGVQAKGPAVPGISSPTPSAPSFTAPAAAPALSSPDSSLDPMKLMQAALGGQNGQQPGAAGAGAAKNGQQQQQKPFQVQPVRPRPFALMKFNMFKGHA